MLLGEEVVDFLGSRRRAPGSEPRAICFAVDRAAIVVTELDQDVIAGLHTFEQAVPEPFGDECPAAAPAAGG